jgi:DNA-directed RNA polymerase II subunit RPB2
MDVENIVNKWETHLWSIIDSYFKNTDNYLCKNQLDSFNRFLEINIPKTVRQFNPLILSYNPIEETKYFYELRVTIGGSIKTIDDDKKENVVIIDDEVNENNQIFTTFKNMVNAVVINDANNIFIAKPIIQEIEKTEQGININRKPLYPNEARLKNLTYKTEIQTDVIIEYIVNDPEQPRVIRRFRNITLGNIPIMLQSKICSLYGMKYDTLRLMGECEYDHGGYFIIDGKEKVIIAQERQIENKIYVSKITDTNSKFYATAEVRSVPENKFQPARITALSICTDDKKVPKFSGIYYRKDGIYVEIPQIGVKKSNETFTPLPIPLFIVFRALGVISDEEILKMIIGELDSTLSKRMVDFLFPSMKNADLFGSDIWKYVPIKKVFPHFNLEDTNNVHITHRCLIMSQYEALMFLSTLIDPRVVSPSIVNDNTRLACLDVILKDYFLPHCGQLNTHKAYYLGYMTRELIETVLGIKSYTDRDSYMYKRVDLAGFLISTLFRDLYFRVKNRLIEVCNINHNKHDKENFWQNEDTNTLKDNLFWLNFPPDIKMKKYNIYRLVGSNAADDTSSIISVNKIINQDIVNDGFTYAFKSAWGLKNAPGNKEGVVQDLARLSYVGFVSHLRRINTPLSSSAKVRPPHALHPSSWGIMCPSETPDGGNIGLRKNLAIFAVISSGTNSMNLLRCLYTNGMESIDQVDSELYKYTRIFLNERIVGYVREPLSFYRTIKLLKRNAIINIYTSITFNSIKNHIKITTDSGRGIRPVLTVNSNNELNIFKPLVGDMNGRTVIQALIDGDIKWDHLISGFRDITKSLNDQDERYYLDEQIKYTDTELEQLEGVIEYIDKDEEDTAMVAVTIHDLSMKEYPYNYCEIHPSLILGLLANCIPFIEMNQGPRHLYAVGQSKQALGLYASNFRTRMDTKGQIMYYPQRSVVKNKLEKYLFTNELPNGINAIVAIGCFTGYNQEDSIIFNKASVERGLFRTVKYRTYSGRDEIENNKIREKIMKPDPRYTSSMKSGNYSKLGDDGLILEGLKIDENDILIGKCVLTGEKDSNGNDLYTDNSDFVRLNEDGFVDKVYSNLGNDDQRYVKVRIRKDKKPELGDKFCSRFGQKGTVGMLLQPYDMPVSKRGIQPDLIVNAHAFPSRMTIAQFLEVVTGKACIEKGLFSEVAAFSAVNKELLSSVLESIGFEGRGSEVLYNGMTGEMMHVNYFIGPTYYQRLTHQVSDKYQSRDGGLKASLTHQPVGGRSLGGGGRVGEMERDALLSHGVMQFLHESFMERSDKDVITISQGSGIISVYNPDKGIYRDLLQDEVTQYFSSDLNEVIKKQTDTNMYIPKFAQLEVPYAFKLFLQEVEAMGISMKFEIENKYLKWDNDIICQSDKDIMDIINIESNIFRTDSIKNNEYWNYIEKLIEDNLDKNSKKIAKSIVSDTKSRGFLPISSYKNQFNNQFVKEYVTNYNISRAKKRVDDIIALLPKDTKITSFIDIGADDGSITKATAEHFNINKDKAFGLNIVDSPFTTDEIRDRIELIKYESRNNTGLPDSSVDLVMLNEVFHHVSKLDRDNLLKEIYRILRPGGYVFLREHDVPREKNKELVQFLQLVHGVYIMIRDEQYIDYYAEYFDLGYLKRIMSKNRFKLVLNSTIDTKKQQRVYTSLFQKLDSSVEVEKVKSDIILKPIKNYYMLHFDDVMDDIDVIELVRPNEQYEDRIKERGMLYTFYNKWYNEHNDEMNNLKKGITMKPIKDDDINESFLRQFYPLTQLKLDSKLFKIVGSSYKSTSDYKRAKLMIDDIVNAIIKNTNYTLADINKWSITDGTSNIGGNSFPFILYFNSVHCIEYDRETYNALLNNMELLLNRCNKLKLENSNNEYAKIVCNFMSIRYGDYTKLYNIYTSNVVFLDVPWMGGDRYMEIERANYKLGDILLKDLVKDIFNENSVTNIIALKLPSDYDTNEFIGDWNLSTFKYKKYKMYVLIHNRVLKMSGGDLDDSDQSGLFEQIKTLEDTPDVFKKDDIEYLDESKKEDEDFKDVVNMSEKFISPSNDDVRIFNIGNTNNANINNTNTTISDNGVKKIELNDALWRQNNPSYKELSSSDNYDNKESFNDDYDNKESFNDDYDNKESFNDNQGNDNGVTEGYDGNDDEFEIISRKED